MRFWSLRLVQDERRETRARLFSDIFGMTFGTAILRKQHMCKILEISNLYAIQRTRIVEM